MNAAEQPQQGQVHRRPGGRTERVRRAVAEAVLDLLTEGAVDFGAADVALRAGVHRSTVHRRWPTRTELIAEALTLHTSRLHIPDTGSFEKDMHELAAALAAFFAGPVELAMNSAMASANDPQLSEIITGHWMPVVEAMAMTVRRAIDRGEVGGDADPEMAVDLLTGPLLSHTLLMREQPEEAYVQRLADAVIRSMPRPMSVCTAESHEAVAGSR
jgi:AcrR family transcriptional regulator